MGKHFGLNIDKKYVLHVGGFIIGSYIFAYILFLLLPNFFNIWNLQVNDQLLKLRYKLLGKKTLYPYIVHLVLNDSTFHKLNYSYYDRTLYGKVINILNDSYVDAVIFDIIFPKSTDQENDGPLVSATRRFDNVYYPVILSTTYVRDTSDLSIADEEILQKNLWFPKVSRTGKPIEAFYAILPFPELGKSAKGIGHITCYPDRDGVFRRFPLLIKYKEGFMPSLSFRIVCDYLNVSPEQIEIFFGKKIVLHDAIFPTGMKKDMTIPIDKEGRIIINFVGPWHDSFSHYSFEDLIKLGDDEETLEILREELEGDLVVISDISTGGKDIGTTPFETIYPLSGLHTNTMNSILTENFLTELSIWMCILIDLVVMMFILFFSTKFRPLSFTVFSIALFIIFIALNGWIYFFRDKLINIVRPSIGFLFVLITINAYRFFNEEKEKSLLRRTFENYFAPSLLNKILKTPEKLKNNEKKVLTVLFSDISGFTSWCSTQSPENIRLMLNEYFDEMAKIIFKYEGTIDKFIGDGLMVFFGDPVEYEDHAVRAVETGIDMQKKVKDLGDVYESKYNLPLKIRIGINTGEVIVGNMGSESRVDYTVLGSNVNIAQRLESNAPLNGILISKSVQDYVKDLVKTSHHGWIKVKGIKNKLSVFEVDYS
jgi:adenylate cyclase